jgi:hypothetical protein
MPITFSCPACGRQIKTADANAGRKATVPITFAVPGESAFAAKAKPKAGRR